MGLDYFFYGNDTPSASDIKDMILKFVISNDDGDMDALDGTVVGSIVRNLIDAYWKTLEATDEKAYEREHKRSLDGGEAVEDRYRTVYVNTYRVAWGKAVQRSTYSDYLNKDLGDDEDIIEGMPWADGLGCYDGGYTTGSFPQWLPIIVANAIAQRDATRSIKMAEWNIRAGIPGTSEYARLKQDCGAEAVEKHEKEISMLMEGASNA